jgi:hypothetical protein
MPKAAASLQAEPELVAAGTGIAGHRRCRNR